MRRYLAAIKRRSLRLLNISSVKASVNYRPAVKLDSAKTLSDLLELGEISKVEGILRPYLKDEPLDPLANMLMGQCFLKSNNSEQACWYFREAEALGGITIANRRLWAEALFDSGQEDAARSLILESIDRTPKRWEYYWDYAAMVENLEQHDALEERWRKLLSSKKVFSDAIERGVAKSATMAGKFDLAFAIYRRLVAYETHKLSAKVSKNPSALIEAPAREKSNDLSGGKGETCLKDLKTALDNEGIEFFLMAGTVLGYIRDGSLLPGDKDVDIGIFEDHYDRARIKATLRATGKFRITRIDDHADRIRAIHINGVWVDVFPHFKEGERYWHAGTVARWWHETFTLREHSVDGVPFNIPGDTEAYLEWNYGREWRVPDSMFDVYEDAPNVEVMHKSFLIYSTWRKIHEGAKTGNWQKVLKYVKKDQSFIGENPWLLQLHRIATNQQSLVKKELPND